MLAPRYLEEELESEVDELSLMGFRFLLAGRMGRFQTKPQSLRFSYPYFFVEAPENYDKYRSNVWESGKQIFKSYGWMDGRIYINTCV